MQKLKPMETKAVIFYQQIGGLETVPGQVGPVVKLGGKYFFGLWRCTKIKSIEPQMVVVEFESVENKKNKIGLRSERVFFQIPFELVIEGQFDPVAEKKAKEEKEKNAKIAKKVADDQKKGKFPPIPRKVPKLPKNLVNDAKPKE